MTSPYGERIDMRFDFAVVLPYRCRDLFFGTDARRLRTEIADIWAHHGNGEAVTRVCAEGVTEQAVADSLQPCHL